MAFQFNKDDTGKTDPNSKNVDYTSPEGISPEVIFDLWDKIYSHFLTTRGHSRKNMDTTNLIHTAESMRLANISLVEKKEAKKNTLAKFEQDLLELIIHENNTNKGSAGKLRPDIQVVLDWQPDKQFFNDATDKVNYYDFALRKNLMTPPDIIRQENPDISHAEAKARYAENKEFNSKEGVHELLEPKPDDNQLNQEGVKDGQNT